MEETTETANTFGQFSPTIIYDYIKDSVYPDSFPKADIKGSQKESEVFHRERRRAVLRKLLKSRDARHSTHEAHSVIIAKLQYRHTRRKLLVSSTEHYHFPVAR